MTITEAGDGDFSAWLADLKVRAEQFAATRLNGGSLMITDITEKYHGGNPESVEAHASLRGHTAHLRARVVDYVRRCGPAGATSDEIEIVLRLPHQTVSARLTEAKARGQVVPNGNRRPTRSGRNAAVLVIVP